MLSWQILPLFVASIIMAHIICGRQNHEDVVSGFLFSRVYLVYMLEVKWIRETENASFDNIELNLI